MGMNTDLQSCVFLFYVLVRAMSIPLCLQHAKTKLSLFALRAALGQISPRPKLESTVKPKMQLSLKLQNAITSTFQPPMLEGLT